MIRHLLIFAVLALAPHALAQDVIQGRHITQETTAPDTPSAGFGACWFDATSHAYQCKNSSGTVFQAVQVCSATVTINCVPSAGADGNVAIGSTVIGPAVSVPGCRKYTVAYTDAIFKADAVTATKTIKALAANEAIIGVRAKHSAAFSGTGITSATVSLGDGTTADAYLSAFNVFQTAANTALAIDGSMKETTVAAHNLVATFTADANLGDGTATALAAGSVDIHVCTVVLP
jgi:hypothetical protein